MSLFRSVAQLIIHFSNHQTTCTMRLVSSEKFSFSCIWNQWIFRCETKLKKKPKTDQSSFICKQIETHLHKSVHKSLAKKNINNLHFSFNKCLISYSLQFSNDNSFSLISLCRRQNVEISFESFITGFLKKWQQFLFFFRKLFFPTTKRNHNRKNLFAQTTI